ncbi:MAG TPA: YdcF family protein, partial [Candidatus Saccharimonadales bacterium]|nr:YdcF family protein [Candidatus Saccharimonadales bacterium]
RVTALLGRHGPGQPRSRRPGLRRFAVRAWPVSAAGADRRQQPTTAKEFPRGEAVDYREIAIEHGVPADQVLTETQSTTTVENFLLTRKLLDSRGVQVDSILVTCRTYQQRSAYAHGCKLWPQVDILCSAEPTPLDQYVRQIGSAKRVIDMMVGDLQRLVLTEVVGEAIHQDVPADVLQDYRNLKTAGYTDRIIAKYDALVA